jgi:hypothetical protein
VSDAKAMRRIARETLEQLRKLPEAQARLVVRFLAVLYLRPADCQEIARILKGEPNA